jgi:hypothetical protein
LDLALSTAENDRKVGAMAGLDSLVSVASIDDGSCCSKFLENVIEHEGKELVPAARLCFVFKLPAADGGGAGHVPTNAVSD